MKYFDTLMNKTLGELPKKVDLIVKDFGGIHLLSTAFYAYGEKQWDSSETVL